MIVAIVGQRQAGVMRYFASQTHAPQRQFAAERQSRPGRHNNETRARRGACPTRSSSPRRVRAGGKRAAHLHAAVPDDWHVKMLYVFRDELKQAAPAASTAGASLGDPFSPRRGGRRHAARHLEMALLSMQDIGADSRVTRSSPPAPDRDPSISRKSMAGRSATKMNEDRRSDGIQC